MSAEFYHKALGGKLDLGVPGERITHARLEVDGAVIVATDGHPDYPAKVGENMGMARMPPTEQSAGEGWLTDRFGINWTVRIERG